MKETASKRRGPQPDSLALPGDWKDAMKHALAKKRPATGWPRPARTPKPKTAKKK